MKALLCPLQLGLTSEVLWTTCQSGLLLYFWEKGIPCESVVCLCHDHNHHFILSCKMIVFKLLLLGFLCILPMKSTHGSCHFDLWQLVNCDCRLISCCPFGCSCLRDGCPCWENCTASPSAMKFLTGSHTKSPLFFAIMEVGGYSLVGKNLLLVWWVVPSSCLVKEMNFGTKVAAFYHSTSKKNIACLMPWVNQHPHHS